jgi:hypothetical protein
MAGVVNTLTEQVKSSRLKGNIIQRPLMYEDPLRVFATAKHLAIERLSLIAREATLTIDIHGTTRSTEASTMLASWLWELEDTHRERRQWLKNRCGTTFYGNRLDSTYRYCLDPSTRTPVSAPFELFSQPTCQCSGGRSRDNNTIPAKLLEKIEAFPCPRTIHEIDFHLELKCLRSGAAATAFFKRVCEDYEAKFGRI